MTRQVTQGGSAQPVYVVNPVNATTYGNVLLVDGNGNTLVSTKPFTSETALRVFIGPTDPISDIPVMIPFDHHQVHEGEAHGYANLVSSLGSGASKDFRLNVPVGLNSAATCPHLVYEVISTGEAEVYLYEGMTFAGGNGGTQRTCYNRNRNSASLAQMTIFEDPTPATTGTNIWIGLVGSGNKAGSGDRALTEWLLAPGNYLARVTSRTASNKVVIRFDWYEDLGV